MNRHLRVIIDTGKVGQEWARKLTAMVYDKKGVKQDADELTFINPSPLVMSKVQQEWLEGEIVLEYHCTFEE